MTPQTTNPSTPTTPSAWSPLLAIVDRSVDRSVYRSVYRPVLHFARRVWDGHRALALVTLGSLALLAVSLGLQLFDGRQVLGTPVWMKPAKFAAAAAVTAPVLAWILGQLRAAPRARRLRAAGTVMAAMLALELVIITLQAVRGVPSHFNNTTTLDVTLFGVMGAGITLFWLAEAYLALRALRQPFATPARRWGIRLGLVATLLGGAVGFVMPRPTPAQVRTLRAGQRPDMLGAHAVGVADGGPGLPVTRWSVEGGDLRAPHFLGLHALQALPLAAILLERRRRRAPNARPVIALGLGWIGLTAVTLWQALRGQPLVAPDAATLGALAVVAVAATALALGGSRSPTSPPRSAAARTGRAAQLL